MATPSPPIRASWLSRWMEEEERRVGGEMKKKKKVPRSGLQDSPQAHKSGL